jgi:hypothetical protein
MYTCIRLTDESNPRKQDLLTSSNKLVVEGSDIYWTERRACEIKETAMYINLSWLVCWSREASSVFLFSELGRPFLNSEGSSVHVIHFIKVYPTQHTNQFVGLVEYNHCR